MDINAQDVPDNIIIYSKDYKVKSRTGYGVRIINDTEIHQNKYKYSYDEFNENGILTKSRVYDSFGNLVKEKIIDSSGKIAKEIFYKKSGEIDYEYIYNYDTNGYRNIKEMYIGKELWYKYIAKRDTSNYLIEDVCHKPSGEIIRIDKFEYDSAHNLIKIKMGEIGKWLFKYEDKRLVSLSGFSVSGSEGGETYEYYDDQKGLLVKRTHKHFETVYYEYSFY